jgi:hypothetical protein
MDVHPGIPPLRGWSGSGIVQAIMIAIIGGFIAGAVHVVTGPDHLGAVAPLALHGKFRAWWEGVRWGCGHSVGVILVGVAALGLREAFPLALLSAGSERLVGLLLIAIGVWTWNKARKIAVHRHVHEHDGISHAHEHLHLGGESPAVHRHSHAAVGIGTLHGLAGSSHLLGILPTLAFPHLTDSAAYLAGFAFGTVAAMALFASGMGWLAHRCAAHGAVFYRGLLMSSAGFAIILGGWWLWTTPSSV